jgi:hypothetical protein
MARNLVYTVALDPVGTTGHKNLAKMLVSSLLRTRFSGDVLVFHNSPGPLFMVPRESVKEIRVETPTAESKNGAFAAFAQSAKHAVASMIDHSAYEKIMFIDCDAVALRNIDHLFRGEWDIAVFAEPGRSIQEECYGVYLTSKELRSLKREGLNSGTWAVSGSKYEKLISHWRRVEATAPRKGGWFREQSAFNRVVLDWDGTVRQWPKSAVALPLCNNRYAPYRSYMRSTILHAAAGDGVNYKLQFLFSAFAGSFLFDPQLALLNILEM